MDHGKSLRATDTVALGWLDAEPASPHVDLVLALGTRQQRGCRLIEARAANPVASIC